VVLAFCGWSWLGQWRAYGDPSRVYARHNAQLVEYTRHWQTGELKPDARGEYAMPRFLADCGATHARQEGDCLVVTFGFLPTDAVPELWFSPSGFDTPPAGIADRKKCAYFRFALLSPTWAECDWDM
jgi:hypothetical protein